MHAFSHRVCLLILCLLAVPVFGQEDLKEKLKGKSTLSAIMHEVDAYYRAHPEAEADDFESEYLHWKRWEWYMSSRLGPHGEFVNIPQMLLRGLEEKERMTSAEDRNINASWTFMGPSTYPLQNPDALYNGLGRVDRITFHPTNANIIFICTPAGGLWNTLNGGSSWNNLTDHLPAVGISGFVISYANTSVMYLLTGDGDSNTTALTDLGLCRPSLGVFKSTDGGVSWHYTGAFPDTGGNFYGYRLTQSPTDPEVLIAATSVGLYRTTNGGSTWTKEIAGTFYDVKFKPGDGTRVYATTDGDFYLSTNSGDTWTSNSTYNINPNTCGSTNGGRIQMAVCPSNSSKVYLLAGPVTGSGTFCGLYLSTDSGVTFTRQSNNPNVLGTEDNGLDDTDQSKYDIAICCRPDLSTSIIVGGCTVWRSTNGGSSWTHATSYGENGIYPYIHPDIHDMAYNPLNNVLYVASDGGLFKSTDYGVTWTDLSPNIETSQFYHLAGWNGNANKLMGGLQDNGIKYRKDNTSAFYHLGGGDGFDVAFNNVSGEPGYGTVNYVIKKYSSNGMHSEEVTPSSSIQFFQTVATHNTDSSIVFLGGADIYKSINSGSTWSYKGASGSWALTSCPSNNTRFYSAGGLDYLNGSGGLYFSSNTGDTWTLKSSNPGFPDENNWIRITDVAVSPTNSSMVWASFGGFDSGIKVVASTNTGDTWSNISGNLPNVPVYSLAIDNANGIYAGTDLGVFYRSASMTQWMPWSNGLPNVPVTDLVIFDDGTTKKIRASTFGRGIWQSNIAETCDAAVLVTGSLEGIYHYEASTSITSSSFIQGGIGTFVSFKAGQYITLTDGFNVVDESEFLGFISPCGQGGIPALTGDTETQTRDHVPAVVLLRRMFDPEDGLPYGAITDCTPTDHSLRQLGIRLKASGNIKIIAAGLTPGSWETLYEGYANAGDQSIRFLPLTHGQSLGYVLLFYEGYLAHFQELDLNLY